MKNSVLIAILSVPALALGSCGDDSGLQYKPVLTLYSNCETGDCPSGTSCIKASEERAKTFIYNENLGSKTCTISCKRDDDCSPIPTDPPSHALCDQGYCYPYVCSQHPGEAVRISTTLFCKDGNIMPCEEADPRPCSCDCADDQYCAGQYCAAKLALRATCTADEMCTTGRCWIRLGEKEGLCVKKSGEACEQDSECEELCDKPNDGRPGYCTYDGCSCHSDCICATNQRVCDSICALDFVCVGGGCKPPCATDADCRDWDHCVARDTSKVCEPKSSK